VDLLSGVTLSLTDVTFLWLEYGRIIAKSRDPNVTTIHDNTRPAQFSLVLSRSCQLNYPHDLSRASLTR